MILGNTPSQLYSWDSEVGETPQQVCCCCHPWRRRALVPSFDFLGCISKCGTVGLRQSRWMLDMFFFCRCWKSISTKTTLIRRMFLFCMFFLGGSSRSTWVLEPWVPFKQAFLLRGWQRSLIDDQSTNPSWTGFPKNERLWLKSLKPFSRGNTY